MYLQDILYFFLPTKKNFKLDLCFVVISIVYKLLNNLLRQTKLKEQKPTLGRLLISVSNRIFFKLTLFQTTNLIYSVSNFKFINLCFKAYIFSLNLQKNVLCFKPPICTKRTILNSNLHGCIGILLKLCPILISEQLLL